MAKQSEKQFRFWVAERMELITKLWHQAHPDLDHTYPDITLICEWAGEYIVELQNQIKELKEKENESGE